MVSGQLPSADQAKIKTSDLCIVFSGHQQWLVQEQQKDGEEEEEEEEEEGEQEEEEEEVEEEDIKLSHSALLTPLQATQGPALASFSFLMYVLLYLYIFYCAGTDLEEENCFIQPPFSDFLVRQLFHFFHSLFFGLIINCSSIITFQVCSPFAG